MIADTKLLVSVLLPEIDHLIRSEKGTEAGALSHCARLKDHYNRKDRNLVKMGPQYHIY